MRERERESVCVCSSVAFGWVRACVRARTSVAIEGAVRLCRRKQSENSSAHALYGPCWCPRCLENIEAHLIEGGRRKKKVNTRDDAGLRADVGCCRTGACCCGAACGGVTTLAILASGTCMRATSPLLCVCVCVRAWARARACVRVCVMSTSPLLKWMFGWKIRVMKRAFGACKGYVSCRPRHHATISWPTCSTLAASGAESYY